MFGISKVKDYFIKRTVRSFLRGLWKQASGALLYAGVVDAVQAESMERAGLEISVAVVVFLIAQACSYLDKVKSDVSTDF